MRLKATNPLHVHFFVPHLLICCFTLVFPAKLGQFSGSTSISSDMMYGEENRDRVRSSSDENIEALKASVKDFFSDVQSRF